MMAEQHSTPSFGGPLHLTQQWPPPPSSMSSMNLNDPPFKRDHTSSWCHQAQNGPMPSIEYNNVESSRLNSNIPGLNTPNPTGQLPPAFPFMGQFPHQHFPPLPFPPAPLPPMAYPPMPIPSFPTQQNHIPADDTPMNPQPLNPPRSQTTNTPISRQDLDHEEGEVTDKEIGRSLPKSTNHAVDSYGSQAYDGQNNAPMDVEMPEDINSTGLSSKGSQQSATKSPGAATSTVPDLEEGEAVSSMTSNSTRDSGSPYNPPVTVSVEPYDHQYPADSEMRDQPPFVEGLPDRPTAASDAKEVQTQPDSAKLPAQLRVQAQGALLGLAPHNIRYNELVDEGVNAMILKRLYEDVGIKVAAAQPDTAATTATTQNMAAAPISTHPVNQTTANQPTASTPDHAQEKEAASLQAPLNKEDSAQETESGRKETAPIQANPQPDTSKPLERKELIARMLAAKAAKAPRTPLPANAAAAKESPVAKDTDLGDLNNSASSTPLNEAVPKEQDTRVKGKNKAQTELAKQRIEQLKKQGLMRSQRKPQSDHAPQATLRQSRSPSQTSAIPSSVPTVTHHPLPERPPEPEWNNTTRLPGLFMMATEQSPSSNLFSRSGNSNGVDTTQVRTTPRKRPRASDFDEPPFVPKRPSNYGADASHTGDRLVIDLSDDEFYGDDENDIDMDTTADQGPQATSMISSDPKMPLVRNFSSLAEPLSQKLSSSVNSRNSTSATPQAWGSVDEENLRKKDLAIREMRRKIAELEQRKKPKATTSPTQSPRLLNSSASSLDGHTERMDMSSAVMAEGTTNLDNNNGAPDHIGATLTGADASEGASHGLSPQILSSMDDSQLEKLRLRYLRKQEIKAGLPSLEAEILKSEAKLAEFKEQKLKLLSEIAKGKQGRQQLIDELRSLDLETNGLTLEDIEVAQRRNAEQGHRVLGSESGLPLISSGEEDISVPDAPAPKLPNRVGSYPLQENIPSLRSTPSPVAAQPSRSGGPDDRDGVTESGKQPSPSSISDSEGSAMDESTDSDSSESVSVEKELPGRSPASGAATVEDSENPQESNQQDTSCMGSDHHAQSLPERPRHTIAGSQVGEPGDLGHQEHKHGDEESHESSVSSEGYEPPEPEEQIIAASAHSPPFSPPPGPMDSDDSRRPLDQAHADKTLTGNTQGPDSYSREFPKVDLLDNEPRGDVSGRKFAPYISPLKYFRAYRYHPSYIDEVSDGYRSLTYSHDIDSMKYLCPFEGAGGTCNDRSCEFQHFREMNLSDDKVLIQMGSLREGKTPEEKDQYIAGLKQIINEMRRDSVKDFMSVAKEIAAYRRRFLQDPSRILPL